MDKTQDTQPDRPVQSPLGEAEEAALSAEPATLEDRLRAAEAGVAELDDLYKRSLAECENVRRRAKQDIANAQKYAVERWAVELIEVKDNLERALDVPANCTVETVHAGVELTLKQLVTAFGKVNLVDIAPSLGASFDPHCHEAMCAVASDMPANAIVDVLRKGYMLDNRVLRAAQVVISKGPQE